MILDLMWIVTTGDWSAVCQLPRHGHGGKCQSI